FQVEQVSVNPLLLATVDATLRNINRKPRQVRRRRVTHFRRGIAVMAAQAMLLLDRPYRRIYLDRLVKLPVERRRKIVEKIKSPRPAIAVLPLKLRMNPQLPRLFDRHQFLALLEQFQLLVIRNARQPQPVYFFVLPQQRFVRSAQQRVPEQPAMMRPAPRQSMLVVVQEREGVRGCKHQQGQQDRSGTPMKTMQGPTPKCQTRGQNCSSRAFKLCTGFVSRVQKELQTLVLVR